MTPETKQELQSFVHLIKKVYDERSSRATRYQDSVDILFDCFDEAIELLDKVSVTITDTNGVLRTFDVLIKFNYVIQLQHGIKEVDPNKVYFSTDPTATLDKWLAPELVSFTDYDNAWDDFYVNRIEFLKHLGLESK